MLLEISGEITPEIMKGWSQSTKNIPHEQYERQNDRILKGELPRSVGVQYATGDQWRNNLRKNEGMDPKQKQHPLWM